MTTRPRLRLGKVLLPGVLAIALFGMMAAIVLNTSFTGAMDGFDSGISITSEIGYALFDLDLSEAPAGSPIHNTEPFLVSFLLIAIVLDAALDAALVLAKREDEGETVAALASAGDSSAGPGAGARRSASSSGVGSNAATDGGSTFRPDSETDDTTTATGGENA